MKRLVVLLIASLLMTGCAMMNMPMPQTVEEFRKAIDSVDSTWVKSESRDLKLAWGTVHRNMGKYAKRCLNFKSTVTTRHGQYGATSTYTEYQRTYIEKTGKYKSYMALQVESPQFTRDDVPEGGYFRYLVDMESTGKGKTRVTFHGPGLFFGKDREALFEAAEGKKTKYCPAED